MSAPSPHDALEKPLAAGPSPDTPAAVAEAAAPVRVVNLRRAVLFAAGLYLAFSFFDTIAKALLLFFTAFLAAIILNAPVRWLETRGVKRGFSVAGVALILLAALATTVTVVGPPLANQAAGLAQSAPDRLARIRGQADKLAVQYPALRGALNSEALRAESLARRGQSLLPRVGRFTLGVFGALTTGFFALVIALYTLGAPKPLIRGFLSAVPPGYRRRATRALTRIIGQLEAWALATLLLMLIIGVISGVGLAILRVPNAVLFGVIAGLGEGIPTLGPILSAIPPILVALGDDPRKAMWVAGLFLVIQQLENNILVPFIMASRLNLHPVSILFFVITLGAFVGVIGALLAVPVAIIVKVIFEEFYEKKRAPRPAALDEAVDQILRAGARPGRATAPTPPPSDREAND